MPISLDITQIDFELEQRNKRGELLIQDAVKNHMLIVNSCFQQYPNG